MSTKREFNVFFPDFEQNDRYAELHQALNTAGIEVYKTWNSTDSPDASITWFHGHGRVTAKTYSELRKYDCPVVGIERLELGDISDPVAIFDLQLSFNTPAMVIAHVVYTQILKHGSRKKLADITTQFNTHRKKLDAVVKLGMQLTQTLSYRELLQLVVDHAASLLPTHNHAFFTIDTDSGICQLRTLQFRPDSEQPSTPLMFRINRDAIDELNAHQKPFGVQSHTRAPRWIRQLLEHFNQPHSLLITPVISKHNLLGFLASVHFCAQRQDVDTDIERLEMLAAFSAVSIGNAFVYEQTETLSRIDDLTGVYNFGFMQTRLDQLIKNHGSFSLIFIDLDGFKSINQQYGHKTGNKALQETGEKIAEMMTADSVCGRFGGDEFVVIMPNISAEKAVNYTQKIIQSIETIIINSTVHLSASAGVAEYPIDAHDLNSIIHAADTAMYAAKSQGRGCVLSFRNL